MSTGNSEGCASIAVAFSENSRHELRESDVHPSLSCGGGVPGQSFPAVREGLTVRRLTPLECARLQGFPDDWLDDLGLSDSAKYRLCGNAVALPVVEWIARRMVAE